MALQMLGAQVFVEPGQTKEDIDGYFKVLEDNDMQVARIRLFGVHVCKGGVWDFSLYDEAFDAAERHNIKLFVTLFPPTDELTDLGGFKFPRSKEHLREIDEYVRRSVEHYKDHPALYKWVLQNEPGTEKASVEPTDLSEEIRRQWEAVQKPSSYDNGYLKADFSGQRFLIYYTDWYLRHISDIVTSIDPIHGRHVNPHQIMRTLPEYDFVAFRDYLTSVGASFHMSWHFDLYTQAEYPLGVSLMSDLIRNNADPMPFWVTEMQGGNTTCSGFVPYCPTGEHVSQYLWTSLAAGAKGVLFWSLNPRASAMEAGDWGLLDYQRNPSDRLLAAGAVAKCLKENAALFESAKPVMNKVSLLYNIESLWIQRHNSSLRECPEIGRRADAVMVSLEMAYKAISAWGVTPDVQEMSRFDWATAGEEGRTVVLPHCIALPSYQWQNIRDFVKNGGRLIVTGLTGYFDENMHCLFMDQPQPLEDVFGGKLREFKVVEDSFPSVRKLTGHLWRGTILKDDGSEVQTLRNSFGKGEVIWLPTPVELGAYRNAKAQKALEKFYATECYDALNAAPIRFRRADDNLLMRTMVVEDGYVTVILNKAEKTRSVRLKGNVSGARVLFGKAGICGRRVTLPSEGCVVMRWTSK